MIFAFFHGFGLIFLWKYYKLEVKLTNVFLVVALFTFYYFTSAGESYLALLIYSWLIYFLASYALFGKLNASYHISMVVILTGLFTSTVIEGSAFEFYSYMFSFSLEHVLMVFIQISLMIGVMVVHSKLSFYKELLYSSRFTIINLTVHFLVVMVHLLRDVNFFYIYAGNGDLYYYQSLFYIIYVFYLSLIVGAVFYENKRSIEQNLFKELQVKQEEIKQIIDTRPSRLLQKLKALGQNEDYETLLNETRKYMSYRKKAAHKRVLERLSDDLLAFVTMETINKEKNVAFEVVVEQASKEALSQVHYFLEMYGIVLDNAVKAARKARLRYVKIVFNGSTVTIENTYLEEDTYFLKEKKSVRGHEERINGLKLLSYLEEESNICVSIDVSYRVVVSLEVDYA